MIETLQDLKDEIERQGSDVTIRLQDDGEIRELLAAITDGIELQQKPQTKFEKRYGRELKILADIRAIVGDPEGRLMFGELKARIQGIVDLACERTYHATIERHGVEGYSARVSHEAAHRDIRRGYALYPTALEAVIAEVER